MVLTQKQSKIIKFCIANGNTITKKDAMYLIDDYYYNGAKHVGEILSRMVNSGMLVRIKPGQFELGAGKKRAVIIENQPNLF